MITDFDERPHRRGIFHWENLSSHLTASAASQLEHRSTAMMGNRDVISTGNTACGKIPMSSPHFSMGIWTPSNTFSWAHPSHHSEQHHDPFNRICTAHGRDQQTDRETEKEWPTDHATPICSNRLHLASAAMQPNSGAIHCLERLVFRMIMHCVVSGTSSLSTSPSCAVTIKVVCKWRGEISIRRTLNVALLQPNSFTLAGWKLVS